MCSAPTEPAGATVRHEAATGQRYWLLIASSYEIGGVSFTITNMPGEISRAEWTRVWRWSGVEQHCPISALDLGALETTPRSIVDVGAAEPLPPHKAARAELLGRWCQGSGQGVVQYLRAGQHAVRNKMLFFL